MRKKTDPLPKGFGSEAGYLVANLCGCIATMAHEELKDSYPIALKMAGECLKASEAVRGNRSADSVITWSSLRLAMKAQLKICLAELERQIAE